MLEFKFPASLVRKLLTIEAIVSKLGAARPGLRTIKLNRFVAIPKGYSKLHSWRPNEVLESRYRPSDPSVCLFGCGKSGTSQSTTSEKTACYTQTSSHTGCCSSHGGFGNGCGAGEAVYTQSGRLVCNDGTLSPSCHFKATSDSFDWMYAD